MALLPRFLVASQRARAELENKDPPPGVTGAFDDDDETAKGMARLFAEVGEAYVAIIAEGKKISTSECDLTQSQAWEPSEACSYVQKNGIS